MKINDEKKLGCRRNSMAKSFPGSCVKTHKRKEQKYVPTPGNALQDLRQRFFSGWGRGGVRTSLGGLGGEHFWRVIFEVQKNFWHSVPEKRGKTLCHSARPPWSPNLKKTPRDPHDPILETNQDTFIAVLQCGKQLLIFYLEIKTLEMQIAWGRL